MSVSPGIDRIISAIYEEILGPYWPEERRLVEEGYRNIPFPFNRIASPNFSMAAVWSCEELLGYLRTWSAVKRYQEKNGENPIDIIQEELLKEWGKPSSRHKITWPLTVLIGKM